MLHALAIVAAPRLSEKPLPMLYAVMAKQCVPCWQSAMSVCKTEDRGARTTGSTCAQAGEVITGLLEYQEAVSMTRAATKGLALRPARLAAKTPIFPIQQVKSPQIHEAAGY